MHFVLLATLYSCFIFASPLVTVLAQSPPPGSPVLTPEIDAFINGLLSDWNSPGGLSVAVVRKADNGTWNVETKGYGLAKADGTNVSERTLFSIGSNSKLFTALATGLLIANQSLEPPISWDTKIKNIIPGWGLTDPVASEEATIIDLMSHRTGMPRHDFVASLAANMTDVIQKFHFLKPSAEFRQTFQYTNIMYTLLSYIPTSILPSKPSFTRYVGANIFEPLGMSSTTYSFNVAHATGNLADGFKKQQLNSSASPFDAGIPRALPFWAQVGGEDGNSGSGPGGIISNAVDMALWLQVLLSDGQHPVTRESVIPAEVIQTVSSGVTIFTPSAQQPFLSPVVYGGGQFQSTYRGHVVVEHDGNVPGFNSFLSRFPFDGVGIAVLTNDDQLGSSISLAIKYRLADQALGLSPLDSKTIVGDSLITAFQSSPPPAQRPENATLPPNGVENIVGVYDDPAYGRIELCLASAPTTTIVNSPACEVLLSNITTVLPGTVDLNSTIPTLLAKWDRPFGAYVRLTHLDQSVFGLSIFNSYPTGNITAPFWTSPVVVSGPIAEFVLDNGTLGFGMVGVWGSGDGVPEPVGSTVRERTEVWFTKM
ncbi:hypothetical protein PC9H_006919 [Pleurotus ostreatus]|uniref:Beta-lactamase-related domain-containing protein n=1 Tax=Pleurotus ostreatus TaxID=5322 RepID=A0A8H6ZX44_PLEOS|nr:uncharacterized protein PC9H_006919 [Pleurotus ostreatus]KAF7431198.1 hypothetical protein PC9H_006919 [Pleurotus ostreatus]KAJ8695654.1 hypothetical protein PTI98_008231 [Pleurotus ostreatus]